MITLLRHILSNVGRVAARDSSRAIANSQDLFIALCEDSAIYGLFKNMKGEYAERLLVLGTTVYMLIPFHFCTSSLRADRISLETAETTKK